MKERKNCPFLILLLLSVIVLTAAGSLEPFGADSAENGLDVSYGGSGLHSIAGEISRLEPAVAEGESFQQAYEAFLNESLPVARVLNSIRHGGFFAKTQGSPELANSPDSAVKRDASPAVLPEEANAPPVVLTDGPGAAPADSPDVPDTEQTAGPETIETEAKEPETIEPENPAQEGAELENTAPDAAELENAAPDAAELALTDGQAAPEALPDVQHAGYTAVGQDYFDDAVFIGDSRIVGLSLYSGWENTTFLAARGMEVYSFFTKQYIREGGGRMTVPEALTGRQFRKVYLMLGINELGSGDHDTFIDKYRQILGTIRELQPDAVIYVMGILNVDQEKSASDPIFNNENIGERNRRLELLAQEMGLCYLDVNEVSCDENGYIRPEYTADGVHLKAKYISLWTDYLMNHAVTPPSAQAGKEPEETAAS